jgi:kynureninase
MRRRDFEHLDRDDPLAGFRDRFLLPPGLIYLDGNSLGPLPRSTPAALADLVERQWGEDLVTSWNRHRWVDLPLEVGRRLARLLGARPFEVLAADSTSINLFKLLGAALGLRSDRRVVLSERDNFPTDLYVVQGLADLRGNVELRLVESGGIEDALDEDVAVVLLSHVDYRTGRLLDAPRMTERAHARGALVLWDLAHSAGVVPIRLAEWDVDLAVGCGYKFLCGGPGAPAFLYVNARLAGDLRNPLSGWFGHRRPFAFDPRYRPARGIARFQCGTPPVLGLCALREGLDLVLDADPEAVRAKSIGLTERFAALVEQRCGGHGFAIASPRDPAARGSHVALRHPEGLAVIHALTDRGVVGDFRDPDILRFGFHPLVNRHVDVWDAVEALVQVMEKRAWDDPAYRRRDVVT